MTSEIKLSICIATFNRGRFIGETLNTIVTEMCVGVEMVVVDGASTDDTFERMTEFVARHPFVRYFREPHNSGIDQDFDKAVSYAQGEYVWLMTDDDLMIAGSLQRVLAVIDGRYELVIVNSEVRNPDLTQVLNPRLLDTATDLEFGEGSSRSLFVETARALTFIGSVVIRRDLWLARQRSNYYGSLFVHVGVIFQSPPIARVRVLAEPVLRIRYGVAMWTPRSFDVWMYKWPGLIWSFGYDESTKALITRKEPWRSPMKLFHFRSKNAYSIAEYRKNFATLPGAYRAIAFIISVFPRSLANVLSVVYLSIGRTQNRTSLYDLVHAQNWPPLRKMMQRWTHL